MNKINLKNNVVTTLRVFETIFLIITMLLVIYPSWAKVDPSTGWEIVTSPLITLSMLRYDPVWGVVVVVSGLVAIVTLWTKIPVVAIVASGIQTLGVIVAVIMVGANGDWLLDCTTLHIIVSLLSIICMAILFVDARNKIIK